MQGSQWKICRVKSAVASGVIVNQELGYMSDFSDSSFSLSTLVSTTLNIRLLSPGNLFSIQYFRIVCACIYACLCLICVYI